MTHSPTTYRPKGFRNLVAWQEAHALTVCLYRITKLFPPDEQQGIVAHLRRSAISIGANIAEGSARRTKKDQTVFYVVARSALAKVENLLALSFDLGYLDEEEHAALLQQAGKTRVLLEGLVKRKEKK